MKRILKSYLFWTYERGSFHYDVMVTLILVFLFLSPRVLNFHDRPPPQSMVDSEVLVQTDGPRAFIYEVSAGQVGASDDPAVLEESLHERIEAISGDVVIDRYETTRDKHGIPLRYKVWAHR